MGDGQGAHVRVRLHERGDRRLGPRLVSGVRLQSSSDAERRPRLEKELACLKRLRMGPPQTAYDMLQFIYLVESLAE